MFTRFQDWLKESFNDPLFEIGEATAQPYPLKKRVHGDYRFETEDGDKYLIKFETEEHNVGVSNPFKIAYVAFLTGQDLLNPKRADLDRVINKGRIFRVLATVIQAIKLYLKDYQRYLDNKTFRIPITYIGMVPGKNDKNDDRRLHIYQAYIKKLIPNADLITSKMHFEDKEYDAILINANDIKI